LGKNGKKERGAERERERKGEFPSEQLGGEAPGGPQTSILPCVSSPVQ